MNIELLFFASLRERLGLASETRRRSKAESLFSR
mgnify:CR=1 FL=1